MIDNRSTHIAKRVGIFEGQKVIFCNEVDAVAEMIPYDVPLSALSANAGLAVAYRLAIMSAPLATGKGAQKLISDIEKKYITAKAEAQAQDERENFVFVDERISSEFVESRLE